MMYPTMTSIRRINDNNNSNNNNCNNDTYSNSCQTHRYRRRKYIISVNVVLVAFIHGVIVLQQLFDIRYSYNLLPITDAFSSTGTTDSTKINNNNNNEKRFLKIAFVTGNEMKAKEVESILNEYAKEVTNLAIQEATTLSENSKDSSVSVPLVSSSSYYGVDLRTLNVDLPELQEVDTMAIAKNKALLAAQLVSGACIVEDTSLHFHSLGGMPGPYIKWFQQSLKSFGLYNILAAYDDKTATAVCTLAFSPSPHADPILFTGECRGTIVPPDSGQNGFGWDSIFVPDEEMIKQQQQQQQQSNGTITTTTTTNTYYQPRTFSTMTMDEKNQLSHRGKAVRKLAIWLNKNYDELFRRQQKGEIAVGHQGFRFQKHNVQVFNPNSTQNQQQQNQGLSSSSSSSSSLPVVSAEETIAVRRLSGLPSEERNAAT